MKTHLLAVILFVGFGPSFYDGYGSVYAWYTSSQTGCGKRQWPEWSIQSNILGGEPVQSNKKWPWIVYIHDTKRFCGASIINANWILTAAHCVENVKPTDKPFFAYAALTDLRYASIRREVSKIVIHPDNQSTRNADIALLKLKTALPMSDSIRPICYSDFYPDSSTECYSIGWGITSNGGDFVKVLHEVRISLWDDSRCKKYVGPMMKSTMMCTADARRNICSGDSGGPLMCFNRKQSQWTVIGIASFGSPCGKSYMVGVFTRVASYVDWITQTINYDP